MLRVPSTSILLPGRHGFLLLTAVALCAQLISVEIPAPAPRLHILWLPGAVLMCALLALPLRCWRLAVVATWLGACIALIPTGTPLPGSAIVMLGHCLLVVPASYLLVRKRGPVEPLESYPWIGLFVAVAGLALPALSASWATYVGREFALQPYFGGWSNIALAHSASYLLLVPAFIGVRRLATQSLRHAGWNWRNLGLIAILAVVFGFACWLPLTPSPLLRLLLLLVVFALLVWLLLLVGAAGAFIGLLALSVACLQACCIGAPYLPARDGHSIVPMIQIWGIAMAAALLSLTVIAEQRASLRLSLANANARLTELMGCMMLVQEEERARIARDLHDDINQSMASISIQISVLRKELEDPERQHLTEIQDQVLDVSSRVRQLSHDLHPSILRYTGLETSLTALCESHNMDGRLHVECIVNADIPLSNEQKLGLFRVAQEAIHNVVTHAQASHARISLTQTGNEVVLQVEDDGIGIPEDMSQRTGSGLGMISMEERAHSLGGHFSIMRKPEGGSRLEVHLPMESVVSPSAPGDDPATGSSS